ncbi:hypothetical protein [Natrinema soli]|uniref:Uncharacterized protein n=1 Tax=Natrinema soli TaxID=1930624 RepID=A0ABD5SR03_9EURY|nr:hypothetical protein [Natrinema soli]
MPFGRGVERYTDLLDAVASSRDMDDASFSEAIILPSCDRHDFRRRR